MTFQELLDSQVYGLTVRTIARILVFGGIAVILIKKLIRRIKGQDIRSQKR